MRRMPYDDSSHGPSLAAGQVRDDTGAAIDLERRFAGPGRHPARTAWEPDYVRHAVVLDLLAGGIATILAVVLLPHHSLDGQVPAPWLLTLVGAPVWVAMMALCRGYERRLLGVGAEEFRAMPRAAAALLAATAVTAALLGWSGLPVRMFVLVFVPVSLVLSLLLRFSLRKGLHRARQHGRAMQRAVVVGDDRAVRGLVEEMRLDPSHGLLPVAACTPGSHGAGVDDLERRGHVHDTVAFTDDLHADVVVVAHPSEMTPHELRRLSWALDERDVDLIVSPGITEVAGPRLSIRPAASLSLVHVERPAVGAGVFLGKAVFDRVVAALSIVALTPVLAVLAIAVRLDSRGPAFFLQERVGAGGRTFRMVKFRSMVVDAEHLLEQTRGESDDGNGVLFKRQDDPRVTRVGRVLRRYSLDELPQLFNVLLGQMSLVGPRPPLQSEVEVYGADAFRRLRVRPGMTGLWQVSGRSDLSWEDSLRLDLRYVDNWSAMLDLQIVWRTVRAVLGGRGAY